MFMSDARYGTAREYGYKHNDHSVCPVCPHAVRTPRPALARPGSPRGAGASAAARGCGGCRAVPGPGGVRGARPGPRSIDAIRRIH